MVASDPIATSFTYSLTNDAGGRFDINASTGQITVENGLLLDFEQIASHTITVHVQDNLGGTADRDFAVTIDNIDPELITGDNSANTFVGGPLGDQLLGNGGNDSLVGGGARTALTAALAPTP